MSSLVKAVQTTHDRDDLFELEDRVPYKGMVIPTSSRQVDRPVKIGRGAQVDGSIYGKVVQILDGFSPKIEDTTRTLSIFGREHIFIGDYCNIGGHVTCAGELSIGDNSMVLGNVVASNIKSIGQGTRIGGNLISVGPVAIAENVHIGGYLIVQNGGVAVGKNCQAYDIMASGDIILDEGVTLSDPIIWSKEGKIDYSMISIGKPNLMESNMTMPSSGEINPYLNASNIVDYQQLIEELETTLK